MEWKPVLALIEKGLKTQGLSADKASKDAGHPDAIRNMYRKAKGELKGGITFETIMDVARTLQIAPEAVCRAAMGFSADPPEKEAIRAEIYMELASEFALRTRPEKPRKGRRSASK